MSVICPLTNFSCLGTTRTCDHGINSAVLYQLSYETKESSNLSIFSTASRTAVPKI